MILSYDLMMKRFSAKNSEAALRQSIAKLEKEGFGLFSFTTRHGLLSMPVYLLMKNGHTDFLVKYLDEINHDWSATIPKTNDLSLLSLAVRTENLDFLEQWKSRGLDWQLPSWPSHPLAEALYLDKPHAVNYLIQNGCQWTDFIQLKYRMESNRTSAFDEISQYRWKKLTTPAYALAIAGGRADLIKKAIKEVGESNIDLEVKVPDPSYYCRAQKIKVQLNIPLGNFVTEVADKTYSYAFSDKWWSAIKPLLLNNFKQSRFSELFNWKFFEDPLNCPPSIYKGLATSFEKPLNEASQKKLLLSFMEAVKSKYRSVPVKSYATKQRLSDLWSADGILNNIPAQTFVTIGVVPMDRSLKFAEAGFMPNGVTSVPVYPATVLKFIKTPELWRAGLENKVLVKQFWELISYLPVASKNYPQASWHTQSWTAMSTPLYKLAPASFGVLPWSFEKPQKDQEKIWKSFDLIAAHSEKTDITKALEKFLTTSNCGSQIADGLFMKRSPVCVLGFSNVFEWAVDRGYLSPQTLLTQTSEILKESSGLVKQFNAQPAFTHLMTKVERRLLKERVKDLVGTRDVPTAL